jgi:uroporphyrinogen decarboxylase
MDNSLKSVLNGQIITPPPIWLMRQAGRYMSDYRALRAEADGFLNLCFTPDWAAEVTMQPIHAFDLDAAIIFADILLIPHALGKNLTFISGKGPVLNAIKQGHTVPEYHQGKMLEMLDPVFQAIRKVRMELEDTKSLIGFAGAPWTVAAYMIEGQGSKSFVQSRAWAIKHEQQMDQLLNVLVQASIDYLDHQIRAGANIIKLFDSWAGLVPPADRKRWIYDPTSKIVQALNKKHPDIPIMAYPRGFPINIYPEYINQTGVDCVTVAETVTPDQMANLPEEIVVQGNLDPARLIAGGSAMEKAVEHILNSMQGRPFVFNLGHGVDKSTPPAHVQKLVDMIRQYPYS